jgi:hypothetical protein
LKNNPMLDQRETDLRYSYNEIVSNYPCAAEHKKLIEKSRSPDERLKGESSQLRIKLKK